eukprot:scaffold59368_cov47-Attheya_sp.AAC.1
MTDSLTHSSPPDDLSTILFESRMSQSNRSLLNNESIGRSTVAGGLTFDEQLAGVPLSFTLEPHSIEPSSRCGSEWDVCRGWKVQNIPAFYPKIVIDGLGEGSIGLPVHCGMVEYIQKSQHCEQAPYGHGLETKVDTNVRRCWQIDGSHLHFKGSQWESILDHNILRPALEGLGISKNTQVKANLYKMLLYEKGGHFTKHRDTEKEKNMFGTLVIQLPSKFEGGALTVSHVKDVFQFDHSPDCEDSIYCTAFYADCEHELHEVASGCRICLVYNLVVVPGEEIPDIDACIEMQDKVGKHIQILDEVEASSGKALLKHAFMLDHDYTEASLSFDNLKGRDKDVYKLLKTLRDSNNQPMLSVSLLLMSKHETGDEDEMYETDISTKVWIRPDGSNDRDLTLNPEIELLEFICDEIDEENHMFSEEPDDEERESYTGNAGPTLQYWYYTALIVFWPKKKTTEVAGQERYTTALSLFNDVPDNKNLNYSQMLLKKAERKNIFKGSNSAFGYFFLAKTFDVLLYFDCPKQCEEAVGLLAKGKKFASNKIGVSLAKVMLSIKSSSLDQAIYDLLRGDNGRHEAATEIFSNRLLPCARSLMKRSCSSASLCSIAKELLLHKNKTLFSTFITAMLSDGKPSLFSKILEFIPLWMDTNPAENEDIRKLYEARMLQLKKDTERGPVFSWCQPYAVFPGSQSKNNDVTAFLRGSKQREEFSHFNDSRHAGNWASKYFNGGHGQGSGYSANATVGDRASVRVTKTKVAFEGVVQTFQANKSEMLKLANMMGDEEYITNIERVRTCTIC